MIPAVETTKNTKSTKFTKKSFSLTVPGRQWTRRVEVMLAAGFPRLALVVYLLLYVLGL